MALKQGWKPLLALLALYSILIPISYADSENHCTGVSEIINLTDRGGNASSPCVIPFKTALLEGGYQYLNFKSEGWQQNVPQGEFRLGLPGNNEIGFYLPNYNWANSTPLSGYSALGIDLKHQIGYNQKWMTAVEGIFIFPGGSAGYGSKGLGVSVDGIATYTINPQWSLTFLFQVSSLTDPAFAGGERYTTVTPDLFVGYSLTEKLTFFGEIFGQTRTGANQSSATIVDCGLLYMLGSKVVIDLGIYRQLSNNINQLENSFIGGVTFEF